MTMSKLEAMRAKLKAKESAYEGGDRAQYPFWDMAENSTLSLRILPDKNEENPFHWVEKLSFKWKFTDPDDSSKKVDVHLPCREMYDGVKTCEIVNDLRPFYKTGDKDDEKFASMFWPKRTFIYQCLVRKSTIQENPAPENPIRIVVFNRMIHEYIKNSILSTDDEAMFKHDPAGEINGTNLLITKIKDGQWHKYNPMWADKYQSDLREDEKAAIAKFGLFDLKSRLPQRPTDEAFAVMKEMFEVAAEAAERGDTAVWRKEWEKHFRFPGKGRGGNQGGSTVNEGSRLSQQVKTPEQPTQAGSSIRDKLAASRAAQAAAASEEVDDAQASEETAQPSKPSEQSAPVATSTTDTSSVIARLRAQSVAKKAG